MQHILIRARLIYFHADSRTDTSVSNVTDTQSQFQDMYPMKHHQAWLYPKRRRRYTVDITNTFYRSQVLVAWNRAGCY